MGRPRLQNRVMTRVVGAAVTVKDADLFADVCLRAGTTQSEVLRAAIYAYLAEHALDDTSAEELPLTG